MNFVIYKDKKKEWRWTLYEKNGRKIADSAEGYKSHGHAIRTVKRIIAGPHSIVEK